MFAIGDKEWPGVSKLIEEAGEVAQVCGKLLGTRGERIHFDGSDLRARLGEELADLLAAIFFVIEENDLDAGAIDVRAVQKLATFNRWHCDEAK
jgi:NTP pyrophosphatase (non-canonical NTP hydrolase)